MPVPNPIHLTTFVGRTQTLAQLDVLLSKGTRLITVTGPPGMGKTRVAAQMNQTLPRSVWADLTQCRTQDDVVAVVASAVGASLGGRVADPVAQVGKALAKRGGVLILDNVDQVTAAAAALVVRWLAQAPGSQVLVTSRERLQLPMEHVLHLPPLGLPASSQPGALANSEAVALFVDRAAQVTGGFVVDATSAASVAQIVEQLDGIPLAIELAAARLGVMTAQELATRLAQRFELLDRGSRDAEGRHNTLGAALDWSWSLLTAAEQDALAQCSVFKGTFTLEACNACLTLQTQTDQHVADVVQGLCDKSLVARAPSGDTQRFRLYVFVAEYAAEKLRDLPHAAQVAARARAWTLERASHWGQQLDTHQDANARTELALDQQALVHIARTTTQPREALTAVLALDPLLSRRGPLEMHATLVDRAIALEEQHNANPVLLARGLVVRGVVRQQRTGLADGVEDLRRAARLAQDAQDAPTLALALCELAALQRRRGELEEARELFDRAMPLVTGLGDARLEGRARGELGIFHKEQGDLDAARAQYEHARQLLRSVGDQRHEGRVLGDLGALHQEEGRMVEARACMEGALAIHEGGRNTRFEALAVCDLGNLALEEGNHALAEQLLTRAVNTLEEMGDARTATRFQAILAAAQAALGKTTQAMAAFERAEAALLAFADPLFLCAARVHRGHLDLAFHRAALASNTSEASIHWARAQQRLQQGTHSPGDGEPSPAELSDDVRLALRVLSKALGHPVTGGPTITVGPECAWFSMPDGTAVDLTPRRTPRRLLQVLLDQRLKAPGQPLTAEVLVAGAWPGERMAPTAATNRLHVTLATLRKLGLRSLLLRVEDGYLLDPKVTITFSARDQPGAV